jgi:hypothetical protein
MMMGKYEPLAARLAREPKDSGSWVATFAEIESVLGFPLPASAHKYREWWGNQRDGGHSQAKGWQDAGWQVWRVDLDNKSVTFRRQNRGGNSPVEVSADDSDDTLFEQASAYLGLNDRNQLIREALKALCQREAGRRLARLGGTMPDLEAPPRRRFG